MSCFLDQLTRLAGLLLWSRTVVGAQIVRHGCIEISASTGADQLHEDSMNSASEAESFEVWQDLITLLLGV